MAAYVECQIIKQIYSGLTQMQLTCSWLDIYNFREHHVGTASQAIKMIAYSIQEKQYRKNVIGSGKSPLSFCLIAVDFTPNFPARKLL